MKILKETGYLLKNLCRYKSVKEIEDIGYLHELLNGGKRIFVYYSFTRRLGLLLSFLLILVGVYSFIEYTQTLGKFDLTVATFGTSFGISTYSLYSNALKNEIRDRIYSLEYKERKRDKKVNNVAASSESKIIIPTIEETAFILKEHQK